MSDSDPVALFSYVIAQLDKRGIAFLDLIEPRSSGAGGRDGNLPDAPETAKLFKKYFKGVLISAGGHTPESAKADVESGQAEAAAFGRYFISNPDLPDRIRMGAALNKYDRDTFYGGTEKGYTDYPFLSKAA